jgi:predicted nucleotidyltransferase
MMNTNTEAVSIKLDSIRDAVLRHVPAKYIYLFGSYAYGEPTEKSDMDIYVVTPDDTTDFSQLCAKIRGDLSSKKMFFIDLLLARETIFNDRKNKRHFEKTIYQANSFFGGVAVLLIYFLIV